MILTNLLLAYQLENYKNFRFLKFIYTHPKFWIFGSKRQKLEYTNKAKLILALTILFFICDIISSIYFLSGFLLGLNILLVFILLPIYLIASSIIISPLDYYLKKKIIQAAKGKISQYKDLKVIAITGSYGKTTTKEILTTTLSPSFNVLSTQGTKNTPLGISKLILNSLDETHEVFIVEMGAYVKGDIAELCELVGPNISVITGITLQHLERFKNLDNIIDAKFEILECLSQDDFAVVDTSTLGVQKGLKEKNLEVENIVKVQKGGEYSYKENLSGMNFKIKGEDIETKLLSNYVSETLQICYEVGKYLGQNIEDFKAGTQNIDFVEHRMQLIHNPQSNVYVIDDSFNGNLEGVASILDLMKNAPFTGRKVLVAGGVVELGDKSNEVNTDLGKKMGEVSDLVLVIDGPVGNSIKKGLLTSGFSEVNIKSYKTALELHDDLKNIIRSGDMVVFQNDLPDHYL